MSIWDDEQSCYWRRSLIVYFLRENILNNETRIGWTYFRWWIKKQKESFTILRVRMRKAESWLAVNFWLIHTIIIHEENFLRHCRITEQSRKLMTNHWLSNPDFDSGHLNFTANDPLLFLFRFSIQGPHRCAFASSLVSRDWFKIQSCSSHRH